MRILARLRKGVHSIGRRFKNLSRLQKIILLTDSFLVGLCVVTFAIGMAGRHSNVPTAPTKPMHAKWHSPPKPQVLKPPPAVAPPTSQASLSRQYGISSGDLAGLPISVIKARLNDYKSLGITWIRLDIPWNDIQPSGPNQYNWAGYDQIIDIAIANHFSVLGIIDKTPQWARQSSCSSEENCPPASVAQFTYYAKMVAARYSPRGVHAWEIWNEPNLNNAWLPTPNPTEYTALIKSCYVAIKAQDPASTVLVGGLGPATTGLDGIASPNFLLDLYNDGAAGYFDAVGYHPYSFPVPPGYYANWSGWSQMADTPLSIRSVMTKYGDSQKQLWITEVGAPTNGPGAEATPTNYASISHSDHVSEAFQADFAQEAISISSKYPWIGPVFWYGYQDLGTSTSTNENFFGLLRYDGSQKPAYSALRNAIK